jgi:hypothetical protein
MRSPLVAIILSFVTLLGTLPALGEVRTYGFTWWTSRSCGAAEHGYLQGFGLATAESTTGGGWVMRFSGPGGDGSLETDDVTHGTVPTACGAVDGPFRFDWLPSMTSDHAGIRVAFGAGSGPDFLEIFGTGSATRIDARLAAPPEGATVSGTTPVRMTASGVLPGVPLVFKLSLDGRDLAAPATTTLDSTFNWNTGGTANGAHRLDATLTDKFGVPLATASRTVNVANGSGGGTTPGTSALKVVFTNPHGNATVGGTVAVNIWVEGAAPGARTFVLALDGKTIATQTCACAHVWPGWNSALAADGTHTLSASVKDAAGNTGTASITVIVNN